jgi:endonuclease/exonuclease/phosphatase family metal-dependent hydrolase
MMQTRSPFRILFAIIAPALLLAACRSIPATHSQPRTEELTSPVLDGDIAEWGDAALLADEQYLYFRWSVGAADFPPQAAPYTTAILLDLDDDPATGLPRSANGETLGIDLEILLSPPARDGTRRGVRLEAISATGERTRLSHAQADFSFSPTYAANWYEARLSRTLPTGPVDAPRFAGLYAMLGPAGEIIGLSDAFRGVLPSRRDARSSDALPPKPADGVRIVSYNILRDGPIERPDPFRRILRALDPDLVLLQEWDRADTIEAWFNANLPEAGPWHVRSGQGGVAIACRYPLQSSGPDAVVIAAENDDGRSFRPVRVITALADTPIGGVLLASVHLKCCGTAGSVEDRTRFSEARAVNAAVLRAIDDDRVAHVVIGGDFNLVGTRPPLDLARAALDADGSDLAVAPARVLGDRAYYTWADAANDFSPGRLDFIVYSDASALVSASFILDTARLGPASLAAAGLLPGDSAAASDHLPVVVDLRPR